MKTKIEPLIKYLAQFKAEKPLCVKEVKEVDGVFTAFDESGSPVAFFGRAFANALADYMPKINDALYPQMNVSAPAEPVDNGKIKLQTPPVMLVKIYHEDMPPTLEPEAPQQTVTVREESPLCTLVIVARDHEQFMRFARADWAEKRKIGRRMRYVRASQIQDLKGYNWGKYTKLVRLTGWTNNSDQEFLSEVYRASKLARLNLAFRSLHI